MIQSSSTNVNGSNDLPNIIGNDAAGDVSSALAIGAVFSILSIGFTLFIIIGLIVLLVARGNIWKRIENIEKKLGMEV